MDDHMEELELDDEPWGDEDPPPVLTLDSAQQRSLGAAVDAGLRGPGCDNTLRAAQRWAADALVEWPELKRQLEGNGGYCDCEVLLNVLAPDQGEPD